MKFIPIDSARGLEIDQPVFVKNEDGYGYARLVEESKTAKGIRRVFEMAVFYNPGSSAPVKQHFLDNITHVCIPKL
jgi:hypothetical protein